MKVGNVTSASDRIAEIMMISDRLDTGSQMRRWEDLDEDEMAYWRDRVHSAIEARDRAKVPA